MNDHGLRDVFKDAMRTLGVVFLSLFAMYGCKEGKNGASASQEVAYTAPDTSVAEIAVACSIWTNARQFTQTPCAEGARQVYVLELGFVTNATTDSMYESIRPGLQKLGWKLESDDAGAYLHSKGDRMLQVGFDTGMHPTSLLLLYWDREQKEKPRL